jgi:hypothetical protein
LGVSGKLMRKPMTAVAQAHLKARRSHRKNSTTVTAINPKKSIPKITAPATSPADIGGSLG